MNFRICRPVLLAGLAVACLVSCGKSNSSKPLPKEEHAARAVRVAHAEVRPMPRAIMAFGTLAAREVSMLSAKVSGRLQPMAVDIGSVVRHGELLAQVEPRDYELALRQAGTVLAQTRTALGLEPEGTNDQVAVQQISAVKQAKAVLEESTRNRDRIKSLSQSQIASQSELDTVEADYTVAQTRYEAAMEDARSRVALLAQRRAEYEIAQKQLADAAVRAPFDGVVQSRSAHVGEYVAIGAAILELVKTDPLRLRLQVPERECALVQTGQVVNLFVEGDTNVYEGRISRLSPALDVQNRMLLVEADVPARGSLRAGLFARARILINDNDSALCVPAGALVTFAGLEKVVVVKEGKALEKVVTTGRREREWVEIVSGLKLGEDVVADPAGLRTGQTLSITSERAENSGGHLAKENQGSEMQALK